jgi:hypothetical protein
MNFEYSHYLSIMSNRMPFLGMSGRYGLELCILRSFPRKQKSRANYFHVCNLPLWVPASAGTNGAHPSAYPSALPLELLLLNGPSRPRAVSVGAHLF